MKDDAAIEALAPDLSAVATCDLHRELTHRRGVEAWFVAPDETRAVEVRGACWIVINRD